MLRVLVGERFRVQRIVQSREACIRLQTLMCAFAKD